MPPIQCTPTVLKLTDDRSPRPLDREAPPTNVAALAEVYELLRSIAQRVKAASPETADAA